MGKLRVVLSGILAAALLLPQVALAAPDGGMAASGTAASSSTLVVNTTTDRRLQDGDVNCVDPGWTCSLRAAVQEANTNPAYDTIMVPAGGYVLTRAGISADGSSGALRLASSVTIVGAGPGLTVIDAGWRTSIPGSGTGDRVIDAVGGSSTIDGVTIRGGVSPGGSLVEDRGGGIHVRPGATLTLQDAVVDGSRAGQGGGIHNAGTLRLVRSEVRDNRSDAQGGGIHASGPVELRRSVVASNTSGSQGGGLLLTSPTSTPVQSLIDESTVESNSSGNAGGGLSVGSAAWLTVTSSTVRGNAAATGGGAVSLVASSAFAVGNSTISGNTATNGTGGIVTSSSVSPRLVQVTLADNARTGSGASALQVGATSAPVEIEASILTAPAAVTPLCIGAVVSSGYNLARDDSCQLTQTSDRPQADPQLGTARRQRRADRDAPTVVGQPGDRRRADGG
jgi:large repetitive protein